MINGQLSTIFCTFVSVMPQEDYLLKYIEKLSRVIAAMLGFMEKGFPEDSLRLADEVYTELLAVDLQALEEMTEAEFEQLLYKHNLNLSYLEYFAEILLQTAKVYEGKQEKEKSLSFYQKSLQTLLFLTEKDKTFSIERQRKIATLKEMGSNASNWYPLAND